MLLRQIYDEDLAQAAWLLGCQKTGEAIVIDPERDVDRYLQLASEHGTQRARHLRWDRANENIGIVTARLRPIRPPFVPEGRGQVTNTTWTRRNQLCCHLSNKTLATAMVKPLRKHYHSSGVLATAQYSNNAQPMLGIWCASGYGVEKNDDGS